LYEAPCSLNLDEGADCVGDEQVEDHSVQQPVIVLVEFALALEVEQRAELAVAQAEQFAPAEPEATLAEHEVVLVDLEVCSGLVEVESLKDG
jgi:hypothetical protein